MNKQTAVEWLVNQEISLDLGSGIKMKIPVPYQLIEQAKQMEKEESESKIIGDLIGFQSFLKNKGLITVFGWDWRILAKQYYNETYTNEK
jgi:hypothetical protein